MALLVPNLEEYVGYRGADRFGIELFKTAPAVDAPARSDIAREGDSPAIVRLMLAGMACRYKDLPDGRRQIVGFFLPGDFCDLNISLLGQMDHSIGTITAVRYLAIPCEQLHGLLEQRPSLAEALLRHELVASSIQREWLLNVGQRSALERMAHLLVELFVRLRAVGLTRGLSCSFPLTQNDLADAAGITSVHVNRTLQELRREGLIELAGKQLRMLDLDRLMELAMFNPSYLHLGYEGMPEERDRA